MLNTLQEGCLYFLPQLSPVSHSLLPFSKIFVILNLSFYIIISMGKHLFQVFVDQFYIHMLHVPILSVFFLISKSSRTYVRDDLYQVVILFYSLILFMMVFFCSEVFIFIVNICIKHFL